MKATYRAMQVSRPGVLELVERPTPTPGPGEVLIAVEACGVCGADAADIDRADPALQPPRVPGHEVVGRIVALGVGVSARWTVGQRVGVGRLGGHCGDCLQCRQGRFQLCANQPIVGSSCDGGYAELMLAHRMEIPSRQKVTIDYHTPRGPWYAKSWKSDTRRFSSSSETSHRVISRPLPVGNSTLKVSPK